MLRKRLSELTQFGIRYEYSKYYFYVHLAIILERMDGIVERLYIHNKKKQGKASLKQRHASFYDVRTGKMKSGGGRG